MTKINDVDILPLTSFELKNNDILKFASSTRSYEVDIDRMDVHRNINK